MHAHVSSVLKRILQTFQSYIIKLYATYMLRECYVNRSDISIFILFF